MMSGARKSAACLVERGHVHTLAYSVAVTALSASLLALAIGSWGGTPVALRFLLGLVAFGFLPGVPLLHLLCWRAPDAERNVLGDVVKIVSLSFSCNLLLNIALFLIGTSLRHLTYAYLALQILAYLLLAISRRRSPRHAAARPGAPRIGSMIAAASVLVGLLFLALVAIAYTQGARPVNPEELVSLRKVVENPSVRYDNISLRYGEPSTYLFTPFQVLVGGVAVISGLDVAAVYSSFWAVTTALSLLGLAAVAHALYEDRHTSLILLFVACVAGIFDSHSLIYALGIITPYPNRYGFSGGVLVPLNLFIFWVFVKKERIDATTAGILTYLLVEMSFVHARETLLVVGVVAVTGSLLLTRGRSYHPHFLRTVTVIGFSAVVLWLYKSFSTAAAPGLRDYVGILTSESHEGLRALLATNGLVSSLFTSGPTELVTHSSPLAADVIPIPNYAKFFVDSWAEKGAPSRLILPLCLLAAPIYTLGRRSLLELVPVASLTCFAAVSASGLVKLWIAATVGNPEVLVFFNIIFILAFCLWAHMLVLFSRWMCCRFGISGETPLCSPRPLALVAVTLGAAAAAGLVGYAPLIGIAARVWTPSFALALHVVTAGSLVVALFRRDMRLTSSPTKSAGATEIAVALALAAIFLLPIVTGSQTLGRNPFAARSAPLTGDFRRDYPTLVASGKLAPSAYPSDIIAFLRNGVRPNLTILSRDTLSVMIAAPHFAAILSDNGRVGSGYIMNWPYLVAHRGAKGTFALGDFIDPSDNFAQLRTLLRDLRADLVVANPLESEQVRRTTLTHGELRQILVPLFSGDGFVVYRASPDS